MLNKTGVPTAEDIAGVTPPEERFQKGPVAVIECYQEIPCNPCYTSCRRGAIKELIDINDRPTVDHEKCNGCGVCVSNCPGLAITVIDKTYSETEASVRIPYEFTPLPEEGARVAALDREGRKVCGATVIKVLNTKTMDRTPTVTLAVPKEHAMTVRFLDINENPGEKTKPEAGNKVEADDDNTIICRCEEITVAEVRALIKKGCTSVDEIKRLSRAGMGPCQGRTCRQLIMQEIAAATGISVAEQRMSTFRPPTKPIKMGMLLEQNGTEVGKNE